MADCTIRFTGLCAFVPNKPLGQAPERMCVVLVDGRKEGTKALDGTKLRRHFGFVRFDLRNLPPGSNGPKEHHGVWYLDRKQVVIYSDDATPLNTASYVARIDTEYDITTPNSGEERSLSWVPGLTKLMPAFSAIDPNCVSTAVASVPNTVLAQVFFNTGILRAEEPASQLWSVSGVLSPQFARQPLAHEVVLTLTGVTKLSLIAKALPGGDTETLDLVPGPLGKIDLTISNLCDENPLRWPRSIPSPRDDDDFKWYYELMTRTQQIAINRQRRGAPLPIPVPERQKLGPNATGVNCFSVRTADASFNMP